MSEAGPLNCSFCGGTGMLPALAEQRNAVGEIVYEAQPAQPCPCTRPKESRQ